MKIAQSFLLLVWILAAAFCVAIVQDNPEWMGVNSKKAQKFNEYFEKVMPDLIYDTNDFHIVYTNIQIPVVEIRHRTTNVYILRRKQ